MSTNKGSLIFDEMLLTQYSNSTNYKEYCSAFILEADLLFDEILKVHDSRFLINAVGAQLDVIGRVLQQSRSVSLPQLWFGFVGALGVDKMSDESTPARGGKFLSEEFVEAEVTPLDDETYRNLLLAKASIMNSDTIDVNTTYNFISLLMGRVLQTFSLEARTSGLRSVQLSISGDEISSAEISLILYATKYFVPAGITFTINQV